MPMSTSDKYTIPMRLMHWVFAVLILSIIGVGWYMVGLDKSVSYKYDLYHLHKSFGVLVLLLLVARLVIRWMSRIPPAPKSIPLLQQRLGKLAHVLLYLFMFVVPASGYLMSNAGGRDVPLFNLVMPKIIEKNRELAGFFHDSHEIVAYTLLGIIVVHTLAALKHRFLDKPESDVLHRMM